MENVTYTYATLAADLGVTTNELKDKLKVGRPTNNSLELSDAAVEQARQAFQLTEAAALEEAFPAEDDGDADDTEDGDADTGDDGDAAATDETGEEEAAEDDADAVEPVDEAADDSVAEGDDEDTRPLAVEGGAEDDGGVTEDAADAETG